MEFLRIPRSEPPSVAAVLTPAEGGFFRDERGIEVHSGLGWAPRVPGRTSLRQPMLAR
jgi:hypothetical protein